MADPRKLDRRDFLGAAGGAGALLLCDLGGKKVAVRSAADVDRVDVAAAKVKKPRLAREPIDRARFAIPEPQPGATEREYWIAARPVRWNAVPRGRDEWMGHRVPRKSTFTALAYRRFTEGFARPLGKPSIPGPTLHARVGDTIKVHLRNPGRDFRQAITMHPHGVRYTPDYDGSYMGELTRAGGFIGPGEEFTYTWEATPDSVGVWPYHDHGPNHTLNTFRGLFGAIVIRERDAPVPDVEVPLFLHSFSPQFTRLESVLHCINGRAFAGNTPTIRAKVGQTVAMHVFAMNDDFHTFHVHGHRWRDAAGAFVDSPTVGPGEAITARWTEDNPGRWLYHCHVFSHQDAGMAGWFLVEP